MTMRPEPMTTDRVADMLAALAEAVRRGDSLEGNFEYLLPGPDDEHPCNGDGCPHVMVTAAYRVGNTAGQGGMVIIGTPEQG